MKILIAVDGSELSRCAVEKACALALEMKHVSLKVVAVYEAAIPMASEPFAISAEYYQRLDDFAEEQAAKAAAEAVERIRTRLPDPSIEITTLVQLGRPAQVIVETAEKWPADLIVVGSHGYGFWGRLALGSVSAAVVHNAPCSVLVVRASTAAAAAK